MQDLFLFQFNIFSASIVSEITIYTRYRKCMDDVVGYWLRECFPFLKTACFKSKMFSNLLLNQTFCPRYSRCKNPLDRNLGYYATICLTKIAINAVDGLKGSFAKCENVGKKSLPCHNDHLKRLVNSN